MASPDENHPQQPGGADRGAPVRDGDLWRIIAIAAIATILLAAFGALIHAAGFVDFPAIDPAQPTRGDERRYYQDALDYREKRLAALVLRSFLTGFSFIAGLALCTQGGIFILRQVTAFSAISANPNATARIGDEAGQGGMFSFQSYSPGVVFLLGGVAVMVATQMLALPIKWIEILPPGAVRLCQQDDSDLWGACTPPPAAAAPASPDAAPRQDIRALPGPRPPFCKQE